MENITKKLMPDHIAYTDTERQDFYLTPKDDSGLCKLGHKLKTKTGQTYGHIIVLSEEDISKLITLLTGDF